MEEVGELHVDRSHGACVLHDPVFVHVRGIVVAGGAGRAQGRQRGPPTCKKTQPTLRVNRTTIHCAPDEVAEK